MSWPLARHVPMAVASEDVVGNPFVDGINAMIDTYASNPEWMESYMTFEGELEAVRINTKALGAEA